jgi:hypothetical protein
MQTMTSSSKIVTCTLILALLVSSMVLVAVCAETPAVKPSVPEFTLEVVDFSYDVPPHNETDHYTGEVRTIPGYHVENKTIKLSVKNQPTNFTVDGVTYQTYYMIKKTPHFYTDWIQTGVTETLQKNPEGDYAEYLRNCPQQSETEYTVFYFSEDWEPKAQIDFQVQALRGHDSQAWAPPCIPPIGGYWGAEYYSAIALDESSGWSDVQTATIPEDNTGLDELFSGFVWTWENTATVLGSLVVLLLIVIAVLLVRIKKLHTKKKA